MLIRLLLIIIYYINVNLCCQNHKKIVHNSNTKYPQIFVEKAEGILENKVKSELLETITIKKINIYNKPIYNIDSHLNNIDKNITILNDDQYLILLAAHSGIGPVAYFKDLDRLDINDVVILNKNGEINKFVVVEIKEVEKDGSIDISLEDSKKLVLTTCSKDENKQLVVTCKLS